MQANNQILLLRMIVKKSSIEVSNLQKHNKLNFGISKTQFFFEAQAEMYFLHVRYKCTLRQER